MIKMMNERLQMIMMSVGNRLFRERASAISL